MKVRMWTTRRKVEPISYHDETFVDFGDPSPNTNNKNVLKQDAAAKWLIPTAFFALTVIVFLMFLTHLKCFGTALECLWRFGGA